MFKTAENSVFKTKLPIEKKTNKPWGLGEMVEQEHRFGEEAVDRSRGRMIQHQGRIR